MGLASDSLKMRFGIAPQNSLLRAKFYADRLSAAIRGNKKITTADEFKKAKLEAKAFQEKAAADAEKRKLAESDSFLPRREAVSVIKSIADYEAPYEARGVTSKGVPISKKMGKALYEDVRKGMAVPFQKLATLVLKFKNRLIGPGMKDDEYEYRTLAEVNKNPKLVKAVDKLMNLL